MVQREEQPVLSLDEFKEQLAAWLSVDPSSLSDGAHLARDLGVDSLGVVMLVAEIEELVGGDVVLPIELVLEIDTVRDAYLQYCALAQLPAEDGVGDGAR